LVHRSAVDYRARDRDRRDLDRAAHGERHPADAAIDHDVRRAPATAAATRAATAGRCATTAGSRDTDEPDPIRSTLDDRARETGGAAEHEHRLGPPPPPQPRPAPEVPVRPGGDIKEPRKIKHVAPIYPSIAITAKMQGIVIIEATIAKDGSVKDARVLKSMPLLDQAAIDAVRQWKFTPTLLNNVPVEVLMTVTVNFTLGGGDRRND